MKGIATTTLTLFASVMVVAAAPAAAQVRNFITLTPEREREAIRMLTTGGRDDWDKGLSVASNVPLEERSPALRAAMREALRRAIYDNALGGEGLANLTASVAANADPADIPVLAKVTVGGPAAKTLYNWGHLATPHLIEAAMSPDVYGGVARTALAIANAIVRTHGEGGHGKALAEAAALHLDGPPAHHKSLRFQSYTMREATATAGLLRTPELMRRMEEIAARTPEELAERTGYELLYARLVPNCARMALAGDVKDFCGESAIWIKPDVFLDMVTNSPDGRGGDFWRRKAKRRK